MKPVFGIQCKPSPKDAWFNCHESGEPLIYEEEAERDAKLSALQKEDTTMAKKVKARLIVRWVNVFPDGHFGGGHHRCKHDAEVVASSRDAVQVKLVGILKAPRKAPRKQSK